MASFTVRGERGERVWNDDRKVEAILDAASLPMYFGGTECRNGAELNAKGEWPAAGEVL
jgi:hypothetical protein